MRSFRRSSRRRAVTSQHAPTEPFAIEFARDTIEGDRAMTDIVIASAARTPVGSFNGAFTSTPAHDLGAVAIKAALQRAKVEPSEVDEVILGQVLTAGQGQNPARQAAMRAGYSAGKDCLEPQSGVRLRLAGGGARHAARR